MRKAEKEIRGEFAETKVYPTMCKGFVDIKNKKEKIEEELNKFKEIVGKVNQSAFTVILETDWDIELWMDMSNGEVRIFCLYLDEEDNDLIVGNIADIDLITTDEYAKTIAVYKASEKDVMTIDEYGSTGYLPRYIHKTEKMEEQKVNEYKHIEVAVDDKYKIEGEPKIYWHDCYRKAFEYCMDKHCQGVEVKLVHGTCKAGLGSYGHAWVEIGDKIVFDGVMQRFYDKEGYYRERGAIKEAEYRYEEAYRNLIKFNRYDDWFGD